MNGLGQCEQQSLGVGGEDVDHGVLLRAVVVDDNFGYLASDDGTLSKQPNQGAAAEDGFRFFASRQDVSDDHRHILDSRMRNSTAEIPILNSKQRDNEAAFAGTDEGILDVHAHR